MVQKTGPEVQTTATGSASTLSEAAREKAQRILDEFVRQLDPVRLDQLIDAPIDAATLNYRPAVESMQSCSDFLERIAEFVQHLHHEAFPRGTQFSAAQARDHAVAVVCDAFRQPEGQGYERGLILALRSGPGGWMTVLQVIAEATKATLREQCVHWVHLSLIDPHDWELHRELCALILERLAPYTPESMRGATAEDWMDCLDQLLSLYCSANWPVA